MAQLRERRAEIEQMLLTRASAVPDAAECDDPEYLDGFRAAVAAAFEYSLAVIEAGERETPAVPTAALVQARIAARNSVGLDAVLNRYIAGSGLIDEVTFDAIDQQIWLAEGMWQPLLRSRAVSLQQLLFAVSTAYENERSRRVVSRDAKLTAKVRALLDCEPADTSSLDYDIDAHHLGLAARGEGAATAVRNLARSVDCRLLIVQPSDESVWAWLGGRYAVDKPLLEEAVNADWPANLALAYGDAGSGRSGWRLTHRQARAALRVALRGPDRVVQYGDVCLIASTMQDDLLATSLRAMYLQPLLSSRDGGETHLHTLRSYFAANRNAASTAAALGVSRQAVSSRLRSIEAILGRPLSSCAAALEVALHLEVGHGASNASR